MKPKQIRTALISVYHKEGLDEIIKQLVDLQIEIYSTGGTQRYIEEMQVPVHGVEELTTYPSILSGRVKTLHPKVFGGILARREDDHQAQLAQYEIPEFDLVIVDLYPFEETIANTRDESEIIEKIDIGGISLIRAAAKNYHDVVVIPSRQEYRDLQNLIESKQGYSDIEDRKAFATKAFKVSAHYDRVISDFFSNEESFQVIASGKATLRYGENPHQDGAYYGDLSELFDILGGKALSYNNLVDIDAAVMLMREFVSGPPCFAILKHTNACGVAVRSTVFEAWKSALAGDPVSAFGGILITNGTVDLSTAEAIDQIFYEVLIAPAFEPVALDLLLKKKKRIVLRSKDFFVSKSQFRSILNGIITQDMDLKTESAQDLKPVTNNKPTEAQITDLLFANKCVKHLKSNTIVLAKDEQLLGMGCGQTSRVDALKQAISKALHFGFDLKGAVMASDAFFPFPDCVEIGHEAGLLAVIQPGGSIRDQDSIDFCDHHDMVMVLTGNRHFKH